MNLYPVLIAARSMLGAPYQLGSKWDLKNPHPDGPIDCSGFVRWAYYQGLGLILPDGSEQQRGKCRMLQTNEVSPIKAVGFFVRDGIAHHVGILADEEQVIEARGQLIDFQGDDIGECVILRSRLKWEAWREFSGWMIFNELERAISAEESRGA